MIDIKKKKYINSSVYLFHNEIKAVHKYEIMFEESLKTIFDENSTCTNVPEGALPDIPRFILSSKRRETLSISQKQLIHKVIFRDEFTANLSKNLSYVKKHLYTISDKFFEITRLKFSKIGIIYTLDIPMPIDTSTDKELFEKFFKISNDSKTFKSTEFRIGINEENKYNINFSLNPLSEQELNIPVKKLSAGKTFKIKGKIISKSIAIKVDINNFIEATEKPMEYDKKEIDNLVNILQETIEVKLDKLFNNLEI